MDKILVSTVIFINEDKKILMEKRFSLSCNLTFWQFPGGKVESNELIYLSAIREIKEELNINIKDTDLEPFLFEEYINNSTQYLIFYFICRKWEGNIKACEQQQLKWFNVTDIEIREILPYNRFIFNKLIKFI